MHVAKSRSLCWIAAKTVHVYNDCSCFVGSLGRVVMEQDPRCTACGRRGWRRYVITSLQGLQGFLHRTMALNVKPRTL